MADTAPELYGARIKQVLKAASAVVVFLCTVVFGVASVSDAFKDWLVRSSVAPLTAGLLVLGTAVSFSMILLLLMDQLKRQYMKLEAELEKRHRDVADELKSQRQLTKGAQDEVEAYQDRLTQLRKVVGGLEQLAFYDPITGIPNSNFLKRQLGRSESPEGLRCLILLDLKNFGEVNKKYNHWKGDRYLSRFGQLVEQEGRRNEYIIKRRPLLDEDDANKSFEEDDVMTFRKSAGGDEFYILLKGSIIDGLGYLNRLQGRAREFEHMSIEVLGSVHVFAFHAGLISIAPGESFLSATKRVMESLGLAVECPSSSVYWPEHDLPRPESGSVAERTLVSAINTFGDPRSGNYSAS